MIAVGLLSLAIAEGSLFFIFIAAVGIILGWLYHENPVLSHHAGTAAALLCVAIAPLDYLLVTQDIILSMGHLLVLLQVVKLLSVKRNRDYLQMFLISLIHLAVASVVTIQVDFSIPFVLYMVFATWTLILFHLKCEFERSLRISGEADLPQEIKDEKTRGVISLSFFLSSSSICVVTLILTSVFFVVLPRVSAGFLWHTQFRPERVSGFSENIDLGTSGEISLDQGKVMRVKILNTDAPSPDLAYFRGVAFSHYDGRNWRKQSPEEIDPVNIEDLAAMRRERERHHYTIIGGKRVYNLKYFKKRPENTIVQQVWQSPLDTRVLFGMHPVYRIDFRSRESPMGIEVDALGSIYSDVSQYGIVKYDVFSQNLDPNSEELKSAFTYPVVDEINYSQLPTPGRGFRYRELKNLAEKIAREANAKTPYEKVLAIQRYLSTSFSYTTKIHRTPEVEPVCDFLFNQKSGHCELFASCMTVLLRTLEIAARVANGFRGGQWNPYGGFYLVRQCDAHCWVEVFFDRDDDPFNHNEIGWVRFDPTPASILDEGGLFGPLTNFFSYLRLKWIDYVVNYDATQQRKIILAARERGRRTRGWFTRVFESIKKFFSQPAGDTRDKALKIALAVVTPVAVVLALLIFLHGRRKRRRKSKKLLRPGRTSVQFYRDFLKILERGGLRRGYSQTPSEFARVVAASAPALTKPTIAITEKFLRVRFGGTQAGPEEMKVIGAAIEKLRAGVRAIRGARRARSR